LPEDLSALNFRNGQHPQPYGLRGRSAGKRRRGKDDSVAGFCPDAMCNRFWTMSGGQFLPAIYGNAVCLMGEGIASKVFSALEKPDWWVVIIAALTGAAVSWQSYETRRAAQAMRTSNRAAINAQRARLRIDCECVDSERRGSTVRSFHLIASNFGATIAEVIGFETKLEHFGRDFLRDFETAEIPDPSPRNFGEPQLVSAGDKWRLAQVEMDEVTGAGSEAAEIDGQTRFPVWYGVILYRDFVGSTHKRRFFFMFSNGNRKFVELGPKGWNSEEEAQP